MKLVHMFFLLFVFSSGLVAADEFDADEFEYDTVDPDPWIGLNKVTYQFNETADKFVLKPIARGYVKVIPTPVRRIVSAFFRNLDDLNIGINNLLQGKIKAGLSDFLRIGINSTLGIGGLFDPASGIGLVKHEEDFGQTLSVWGVPAGPYLVIPLFGPGTLTDAITMPLDSSLDPLLQLYPVDHRNTLYALRATGDRAGLLAAESVAFGDRYIFLRDAYLQRRNYLVLDGEVEDMFDEDF